MIVYKITNKITGKSYIGCTKHSLSRRWQQHKSVANTNPNHHFHHAINKYGADEWDHNIIYTASNLDDMLVAERNLIEEHDTFHNGYNSSIGGEQSNVMTGSNNPMYGINRDLRGINNPMYGKSHSSNAKKLIGDSHRGHSRKWGNHSDDAKNKIRESQRDNMKSCLIAYDTGATKQYPSLKALSDNEGIDYQRVKQVARSKSGYSRKHKCTITV